MPFSYTSLIGIENLFQAWDEFKKGKRRKIDVQTYERNLEDNLFELHRRLKNKTYKHGGYQEFWVNDPKRRRIHKAVVEDRIVHHLLYKYLYDVFDKTFIYDSYSCRIGKGTHKAVKRLEAFSRKLSRNYTQDFWALKLDIKQFFANVDYQILKQLIRKKVTDGGILRLLDEVIDSFSHCHSGERSDSRIGFWTSQNDEHDKGIPLGNLTSQIFANIYLNELDQFVKQTLKIRYYLRYADDFVILDRAHQSTDVFAKFLHRNLKLELHPNKITLRKFSWGIDFCVYVVLPHYVLPRAKTKRRILKKILIEKIQEQSLQSYLGYFSHVNAFKISKEVKNQQYFKSTILFQLPYTPDTFPA